MTEVRRRFGFTAGAPSHAGSNGATSMPFRMVGTGPLARPVVAIASPAGIRPKCTGRSSVCQHRLRIAHPSQAREGFGQLRQNGREQCIVLDEQREARGQRLVDRDLPHPPGVGEGRNRCGGTRFGCRRGGPRPRRNGCRCQDICPAAHAVGGSRTSVGPRRRRLGQASDAVVIQGSVDGSAPRCVARGESTNANLDAGAYARRNSCCSRRLLQQAASYTSKSSRFLRRMKPRSLSSIS